MLRNKIQAVEATDPNFAELSLAERRKKLRVKCYVHVYLDSEDESQRAIVTDISMDGVRLKSPVVIEQGEEIDLLYCDTESGAPLGKVRCQAVWVQRNRDAVVAGMIYKDSRENMTRSWVKFVLEQLGFDESKTFQRRKYIRAEGSIPARVLAPKRQKGSVVNLGMGGALVDLPEIVAKGNSVELEICLWRILPALKLTGNVLEVRSDPASGQNYHSVLFDSPTASEVKLLGNYVIHLINQTSL